MRCPSGRNIGEVEQREKSAIEQNRLASQTVATTAIKSNPANGSSPEVDACFSVFDLSSVSQR
jgi:hypothetical protein